jgi:hypothetical protein
MKLTIAESEKLAMQTDYAVFASGCEINIADAGAFFNEGFECAKFKILRLINDDSYAATFQTLGQYRSALLKEIIKP